MQLQLLWDHLAGSVTACHSSDPGAEAGRRLLLPKSCLSLACFAIRGLTPDLLPLLSQQLSSFAIGTSITSYHLKGLNHSTSRYSNKVSGSLNEGKLKHKWRKYPFLLHSPARPPTRLNGKIVTKMPSFPSWHVTFKWKATAFVHF